MRTTQMVLRKGDIDRIRWMRRIWLRVGGEPKDMIISWECSGGEGIVRDPYLQGDGVMLRGLMTEGISDYLCIVSVPQ